MDPRRVRWVCAGAAPLMVTSGCFGFGRTRRARAPKLEDLPPPTQFQTYRHDLRYVGKRCYHTGPCVGYTLKWPEGTRVHLELRAEVPAVLIVDNETHRPDADGVVRFRFLTKKRKTSARILVAAKDYEGRGKTELRVGPAPIEEVTLPKPPPTAAELAERAAARAAEAAQELRDLLAKTTHGFTRAKRSYSGTLETEKALKIPIRKGRCYRVVLLALQPAKVPWGWTAPRLQYQWKGWSVGSGFQDRTQKSRRGWVSRQTCPFRSGKLTVQWQKPSQKARAATGPYRLELWTRTISSRDLRALEREETESHQEGGCRVCRREARECFGSGRRGCRSSFYRCLKEQGVPRSRCD